MFRIFVPEGGRHRGTCECQYPECDRVTREGKPYCSTHIEESPYIKVVIEKIQQRDREEVILDSVSGEIPRDGFFAKEAILLLRMKDYNVKSLGRRLDISHLAASRLAQLLIDWGLAKKVKAARGGITITGSEKKLPEIDD